MSLNLMKLKPTRFLAAVVVLTVILGSAAWLFMKSHTVSIKPRPESEVELTLSESGATYKLYKGDIYRVNSWSGKWEFVKNYYDPDFYAKNYVERDGSIFRKGDKDELVQVKKSFADDFEGSVKLADLIGIKRGWTACELQSPEAPTVNDYVNLRKRILIGESDFLDNRIEPSGEVVHGGKTALKSVSVPASRNMVTAK